MEFPKLRIQLKFLLWRLAFIAKMDYCSITIIYKEVPSGGTELGKRASRHKISATLLLGVMIILMVGRMQSAYAWQLGWYTTDSVNDYGAGSDAAVFGGLSSSTSWQQLSSSTTLARNMKSMYSMRATGAAIGSEAEWGHSGIIRTYSKTASVIYLSPVVVPCQPVHFTI